MTGTAREERATCGPSRAAAMDRIWVITDIRPFWPNEATATACTTSAHSIGDSMRIIQHGDADVMIAGGSEAAITPMGVGGFAVFVFGDREAPGGHEAADALVDFAGEAFGVTLRAATGGVDCERERDLAARRRILL